MSTLAPIDVDRLQIAKTRSASKRTEHIFFLTVVALIAASVYIGFAQSYFRAGIFRAKLPSLLVHIHGALFSAWIILLVTQVVLVITGKVHWHIKLGNFGFLLAPLMVVVGTATTIAGVRRHFDSPMGEKIILVANTQTICIFGAFVLWAYLSRKNADTHKRLILLATCIILGPAIVRWPFAFMQSLTAVFTVLDSFVALLVIYDLCKLHRLHRATLCGVLATAVWQLTYSSIARSAVVDHIVSWLQN